MKINNLLILIALSPLTSIAQSKNLKEDTTFKDNSKTFVVRSINELDRFAVNIGEEIKDLFRKKRDYKPFTNNHEKPIKSHVIPKNYIETKVISSTTRANFTKFQIEKIFAAPLSELDNKISDINTPNEIYSSTLNFKGDIFGSIRIIFKKEVLKKL